MVVPAFRTSALRRKHVASKSNAFGMKLSTQQPDCLQCPANIKHVTNEKNIGIKRA
jgi:hypothetical protein